MTTSTNTTATSDSQQSGNVAGIDLGTGMIKLAVLDEQGQPRVVPHPNGDTQVPSAVFLGDDGPVFGREAEQMGFLKPKQVAHNAKRHLGSDKPLAHGPDGSPVTAKQAVTMLFKYARRVLEQSLGEPVRDAVVCIPANLHESKRRETRSAAEDAGFNVLQLLHEPSAAGLGNKLTKRSPGLYLVIDIGAGTTDVSLLEVSGNNIGVLASNGIAKLGGLDFSSRLIGLALDEFEKEHGVRPDPDQDGLLRQELADRAETAKRALSTGNDAAIVISHNGNVSSVQITRERFDALISDLIDQVFECAKKTLNEQSIGANDLKGVLCVGGPSKMPLVRERAEAAFGIPPIADAEQHFAAALGAALGGRIELDRLGCSPVISGRRLPAINLFTQEVTTHPLGVAVLEYQSPSQETVHSVLIDKGARMPSDQTGAFSLAEPGQTTARIELLQGPDGAASKDCEALGFFELEGMPPIHDRPHVVEVRFRIDRDGMLTATAHDTVGGRSAELQVSACPRNDKRKSA